MKRRGPQISGLGRGYPKEGNKYGKVESCDYLIGNVVNHKGWPYSRPSLLILRPFRLQQQIRIHRDIKIGLRVKALENAIIDLFLLHISGFQGFLGALFAEIVFSVLGETEVIECLEVVPVLVFVDLVNA